MPTTRDHYGLIECTAKNEIGIQREPCRYLIVPAAGPYFPYSCLVSNQSDSSVNIQCDNSIVTTSNTTIAPGKGKMSDLLKHVALGSRSRNVTNRNEDDDDDDVDEERNELNLYTKHKSIPPYSGGTALHSTNLTTSDIYALYFAPDQGQPRTSTEDNQLTYRNGGTLPQVSNPNDSQHQLATSAQLLLNELQPRFNSHSLSGQAHLLVYPPTYYVCEIYAASPRPSLIKVSCVVLGKNQFHFACGTISRT